MNTGPFRIGQKVRTPKSRIGRITAAGELASLVYDGYAEWGYRNVDLSDARNIPPDYTSQD